jgi:hypothetical protein
VGLANITEQLAPGGFLLAYEATRPLATFAWGLDKVTWNFTDEREYGLWMRPQRWHRQLAAAGLVRVCEHTCALKQFPWQYMGSHVWNWIRDGCSYRICVVDSEQMCIMTLYTLFPCWLRVYILSTLPTADWVLLGSAGECLHLQLVCNRTLPLAGHSRSNLT